ncbi:MAG: MiaB/RimO family radical SAM methylthiotransferase [Spirochaetaceae bacterium]|nr:MAG: MiaB/RimO family radical SAM methylthiotransferase [Spirochaetaceae bacterium]
MGGQPQSSMTPDAHTTTKRVAFHTLGCKLNQHETESIAADFRRAGYTIVPFGETADAYIINTCTVTAKADRKSRNTVNRALRSRSSETASSPDSSPAIAAPDVPGLNVETLPTSVVVVTGCFVEASPQVYRDVPGLYMLDNRRKSAALEIVEAHLRGEIVIPERHAPAPFNFDTPSPVFRTRGTVKIQDGCNTGCSYCIIPVVRGRALSRPAAEVREAVRSNIERGYREIVLTGINMSRYHDADTDFPSLLRQLLELPGQFRLRLSSLEPELLTEPLLEMIRHPRFMPHLHLCLQSGSDRILSLMNRGYTRGEFTHALEAMRAKVPDFHFTTDIIVGFPGETEADFQESLEAVRELEFGHVHTFPYSSRSRTRAARMAGHIPESVKAERANAMRRASAAGKLQYRRSLLGREEEVLIERVVPGGSASGYGRRYVPITLRDSKKELKVNELCKVVLSELEIDDEPVFHGRLL